MTTTAAVAAISFGRFPIEARCRTCASKSPIGPGRAGADADAGGDGSRFLGDAFVGAADRARFRAACSAFTARRPSSIAFLGTANLQLVVGLRGQVTYPRR